ncbi:hypothetical protein [Burkholderia multivorans]|uniref:hypothetical protein n=1 Tax=Burkholderia multivorans TaxID=87883 RepID=UPI002019A711|nr:hypothetical protein [Burkholderia multivorans]MCL4651601.1 hypothetical protein [Burkholderia multivorans]MCL4655176.1 hypothetical protein [Burkholderia multivorans]MCO1426106.1 hypothetical protein [Burkholderia multivorans]UQN51232.1 hypothetical protein L0Y88_09205 [Burkholderia multivorans]UQN84418.1 hypothetical protein L0Z18_19395 [Burkholderia multivorans]
MAIPDYLAYDKAQETLKDLIAGQVISLPSKNGTYSGAEDAQYIKEFVTALAEFYKSIPNA